MSTAAINNHQAEYEKFLILLRNHSLKLLQKSRREEETKGKKTTSLMPHSKWLNNGTRHVWWGESWKFWTRARFSPYIPLVSRTGLRSVRIYLFAEIFNIPAFDVRRLGFIGVIHLPLKVGGKRLGTTEFYARVIAVLVTKFPMKSFYFFAVQYRPGRGDRFWFAIFSQA